MIYIFLSALLGPLGDFFTKKSISGSLWYICIPVVCWGVVSPYLWYRIYKTMTLTSALVVFNPLSMIVTAALGILVFKEELSIRMIFAMVFALLAVYLGSGK